jgi:hypothetical protein
MNSFYRSKYIYNNGVFEIRNYFDNTLYKTENVNTIPFDEFILPNENGDYIGVYYLEGNYFIVDNWYDIPTGWIWPPNMEWELNYRRTI